MTIKRSEKADGLKKAVEKRRKIITAMRKKMNLVKAKK